MYKSEINRGERINLLTVTSLVFFIQMDGLVRVNGEVMDEPVSALASPLAHFAGHATQDIRDVSLVQEDSPSEVPGTDQQAEKKEKEGETKTVKTEEQRLSSGVEGQHASPQRHQEAKALQREEQVEKQKAPMQSEEQTPVSVAPPPPPASLKEEQMPPKPPRHPDSVPTFSGSAISSLIGGRNCVITTTIVTELTQTRVEPLESDCRTNEQVTCRAADSFFCLFVCF